MSLSRTPLAAVLPATPTGRLIEQPFKAKLSSDGHKHPVTRGLAGLGGARSRPGAAGSARSTSSPSRGRMVMNGAEDRPLLVLDRKGKGRVALLLSDHAWLWARGYEGGGPHTDLLRRLSHWLMKEPDLEEERLIASAKGLKLTIERRSMEETVGPVQVSAPGRRELRGDAGAGRAGRVALHHRCEGARPLQAADAVDPRASSPPSPTPASRMRAR